MRKVLLMPLMLLMILSLASALLPNLQKTASTTSTSSSNASEPLWSGNFTAMLASGCSVNYFVAGIYGNGSFICILQSGGNFTVYPNTPSVGDILWYNGSSWINFPRPSLGGSQIATLQNNDSGNLNWNLFIPTPTPSWNQVLTTGSISGAVDPLISTSRQMRFRHNQNYISSPNSFQVDFYGNGTLNLTALDNVRIGKAVYNVTTDVFAFNIITASNICYSNGTQAYTYNSTYDSFAYNQTTPMNYTNVFMTNETTKEQTVQGNTTFLGNISIGGKIGNSWNRTALITIQTKGNTQTNIKSNDTFLMINGTNGTSIEMTESGKICTGGDCKSNTFKFQALGGNSIGYFALSAQSSGTGAIWEAQKARGGIGRETAVNNSDQVLVMRATGYSQNNATSTGGQFTFEVDQQPTTTEVPMSFAVYTGGSINALQKQFQISSYGVMNVSNVSSNMMTKNDSTPVLQLIGQQDADDGGTFGSLFTGDYLQGNINDLCSSGGCSTGVSGLQGKTWSLNASASFNINTVNATRYDSLGKKGKTTSFNIIKSVDFIGLVTTSCSANVTGGIVTIDSSC